MTNLRYQDLAFQYDFILDSAFVRSTDSSVGPSRHYCRQDPSNCYQRHLVDLVVAFEAVLWSIRASCVVLKCPWFAAVWPAITNDFTSCNY